MACESLDASSAASIIGLYDVYLLTPPYSVIMNIEADTTIDRIMHMYSRSAMMSIIPVHAARSDTPITLACLRSVLDLGDNNIWHIILSAYAARQSNPIYEEDILAMLGTPTSIERLRTLRSLEPSSSIGRSNIKRVMSGYESMPGPIAPMPLLDVSEYKSNLVRSTGLYHHITYYRLLSSINIFEMRLVDAKQEAWITLSRHYRNIGTVEATLLCMIMDRYRMVDVMHLMGSKSPRIAASRISSRYQDLVISSNLSAEVLDHYIMMHDIDISILSHIIERLQDGDIEMETAYYHALGKLIGQSSMSEVDYLLGHIYDKNIRTRLSMIKKMKELDLGDGDHITLGADHVTNIPKKMLLTLGAHTFSSSDIYNIMTGSIVSNPYTNVPFSEEDTDKMKSFLSSLIQEGYPIAFCTYTDTRRPLPIDHSIYDHSVMMQNISDRFYPDTSTLVNLHLTYKASIFDIMDIINITRSSCKNLDGMVQEMYPESYKWITLNTGP